MMSEEEELCCGDCIHYNSCEDWCNITRFDVESTDEACSDFGRG
jgi:hypothetical protein